MASFDYRIQGSARVFDRLIGFPDVRCHQADMAESDDIGSGDAFPKPVGEQFQVLPGGKEHIYGSQGAILPVHPEGFRKAENLRVKPNTAWKVPGADGGVAQAADGPEAPGGILLAHGFSSFLLQDLLLSTLSFLRS